MWLCRPPNPQVIHPWHIVGIVALTGYANVVANRVLDSLWNIPFNLAILGVAVAIARHAGVTWVDMGLWRKRLGRGFFVGGIVMAVIAAGIAIGVTIPATREFFYDDRVVDSSTALVLFNALLRIPIATAFYEEMLFRGVLFGMFARKWAPLWAALASSALFGLWHILPTIDTLDTNPAGDAFNGLIGAAIAAVVAVAGTAIVGVGFLWLRLRANSTVAPILVHIATNSFALLAALLVVRVL
ncbi:MAG: type II CAAX endopeptidase family protein [Acidimicrobiia bacterium]|nr:MAG: type II CAAX endopeptidase family protein [Acidimicrobiia bacterium]